MDQQKICFILCGNNAQMEQQCIRFIQALSVPEGFETEYQIIHGGRSMSAGYNEAMCRRDAK